jgi:hypothetical protein
VFRLLAWGVLALHVAFVLWVVFGALVTKGRPVLRLAHLASLIYAIIIESAVLPCPLTGLEQWALRRSGLQPYEGDFLVRCLESVVYPDVPLIVLIPSAVAVCCFNLGIYVFRWRRSRRTDRAGPW